MSQKAAELFTKISNTLAGVTRCISLEELTNLGYRLTGEKFNVVNNTGRITYTVHELADNEAEIPPRTVTFCYAYDYPGKCGKVLREPYTTYRKIHEAQS